VTPLNVIHPDLLNFASESRPLRPSRVSKLLACPMSIVLTMHEEREGGAKAQTGNILHDLAEHYHKAKGSEADRIAAGLSALEAARAQFPEGDPDEALKIFRSYTADQENALAVVPWCEEPVRLVLPADPGDPTGQPVVIQGTLDQVRRSPDGTLSVWDIKTGTFHDAHATVLEYLTQQAVYTLAARATLDPEIQPGGIIYTNGYRVTRGRVHVPNPLTVAQCEDLVLMVPPMVASVRRGEAAFRPGNESCRFCHVKPWPKCHSMFRGVYGG